MTRRIAAVARRRPRARRGGAVLLYVRTADARALAGQQAVKAYIAADAVPAGTTLRRTRYEGLIRPELVALKGVPAGARAGRRHGTDLRAVGDIAAGEIVLPSDSPTRSPSQAGSSSPRASSPCPSSSPTRPRSASSSSWVRTITVFDTFNVQEADADDVTPAGDQLRTGHEYTRATRVLLAEVEVLAVGQTTTKQTPPTSGRRADGCRAAGHRDPDRHPRHCRCRPAQAQKLVHGIQTRAPSTSALRGQDLEIAPGPGVSDRGLFQVEAP